MTVDYELESDFTSGVSLSPTDFDIEVFTDTKNLGNLNFIGNPGTPEDHYITYKSDNISGSIPITTSEICYTIDNQTVGSNNITLSGSIYDSPSEISNISIDSGSINIRYINNNVGVQANSFIFPAPSYSIIPYFNITGDTDEELNISLGLTRTGQLTKAWSFEENIYDLNTLIQKDSTSDDISTFSKDVLYFPYSCKVKTVIVDKGVYLLNVDHMIQ